MVKQNHKHYEIDSNVVCELANLVMSGMAKVAYIKERYFELVVEVKVLIVKDSNNVYVEEIDRKIEEVF